MVYLCHWLCSQWTAGSGVASHGATGPHWHNWLAHRQWTDGIWSHTFAGLCSGKCDLILILSKLARKLKICVRTLIVILTGRLRMRVHVRLGICIHLMLVCEIASGGTFVRWPARHQNPSHTEVVELTKPIGLLLPLGVNGNGDLQFSVSNMPLWAFMVFEVFEQRASTASIKLVV